MGGVVFGHKNISLEIACIKKFKNLFFLLLGVENKTLLSQVVASLYQFCPLKLEAEPREQEDKLVKDEEPGLSLEHTCQPVRKNSGSKR
jgi:hypothetical protein